MAPRPRSSIFKDSFRKRSRTVIHKAHELADRYGAQVYVVVQFNGKFQTYNSVEGEQWPPSTERIVSVDDSNVLLESNVCLEQELSTAGYRNVFQLRDPVKGEVQLACPKGRTTRTGHHC